MTVINPEATGSYGQSTLIAVLTVADPANPSLATEINAASSVNLSFFLRDFNPTAPQNKGTAPRRAGTKTQLDKLGAVQYAVDRLRCVYAPQEAAGTDNNKARDLLTEGTKLYIYEFPGIDPDTTAITAADLGRYHYLQLGKPVPGRSGDGEFDEYEMQLDVEYLLAPGDCTVAA